MKERLFINGAEGFTGLYLTDAALAAGWEVHAFVRGRHPWPATAGLSIYRGDLLDVASLSSALQQARPTKVAHLAAIAFVATNDIESMYRVNVVGTRNLLHALSQFDERPLATMVVSSANIYGNRTSGALGENAPFDPVNDYAVSKVATEYVSALYHDQLPLIITRPFNYTGVGQSIDFLVPKIIDHVRRRAPYIELGRIDVERDFSDVRDVAARYLRLLSSSQALGRTFNICSGRAYSLLHIVQTACDIAGHQMEIRVNPKFVRDADVKTLLGDATKLQSAIGPDSPRPLEETLRWMMVS